MKSCVIFCAGGFSDLAEPLRDGDYVIAADGGLLHTQKLGRSPDCVLGDFDSLGYVPENALRFPIQKDDTDALLAIRQGLSLGFRRFVLYGSLDGDRLDHTVANLQALQFLADHGASGFLVGEKHIVTLVKNGAVQFPKEAKGILSVFCMGADARGVTLSGLQYPLEKGILTAGFPLGVSNHFTGQAARVQVAEGSLLLIYPRENGFPQEVSYADL